MLTYRSLTYQQMDCCSLMPCVKRTTNTIISLPCWRAAGSTLNRAFCRGTSTVTLYLGGGRGEGGRGREGEGGRGGRGGEGRGEREGGEGEGGGERE